MYQIKLIPYSKSTLTKYEENIMKVSSYKQFVEAVKNVAKKGAETKPVKLIKAGKTVFMTSINSLNDKQQTILVITANIETVAILNALIKRDKQAMVTYLLVAAACGVVNAATGVYEQIKMDAPDAFAEGLKEYYGEELFKAVNEEVTQFEITTLQ